MKHCKITMLVAAAFLVLFMPIVSLANTQTCFVNPNGGLYYHARRDCERIAEKYWPDMIEIYVSKLSEDQYATLTQCTGCYGTVQPSLANDDPYHAYYQSPYDTADDVFINAEGNARVGGSLKPGIYTAWSDTNCSGSLLITDALGQAIHTYTMQGAASYTFYLGEGMAVSLPAYCSLRKLQRNVGFQQANQKNTIVQSRYITMLEIPGREYFVTNIDGEKGFCRISSIESEISGEPVKQFSVSEGEVISINLQGNYDTFVEFVHCIVWFEDAGNG
ncbi:MAG: hypothetical protein RR816_05025 [Clostridia bacterium]